MALSKESKEEIEKLKNQQERLITLYAKRIPELQAQLAQFEAEKARAEKVLSELQGAYPIEK